MLNSIFASSELWFAFHLFNWITVKCISMIKRVITVYNFIIAAVEMMLSIWQISSVTLCIIPNKPTKNQWAYTCVQVNDWTEFHSFHANWIRHSHFIVFTTLSLSKIALIPHSIFQFFIHQKSFIWVIFTHGEYSKPKPNWCRQCSWASTY